MYKDIPIFVIKNNLRTAGITRQRYFELLKEVYKNPMPTCKNCQQPFTIYPEVREIFIIASALNATDPYKPPILLIG